MRRILSSALLLIASASLLHAAESPVPGSGSQKSGNRSAESAKKSPPSGPAQGAGNPGAEATKRKTPVARVAPVRAGSEDERFANARKAASEDPKVLELREKADLAKTGEAGSKAMRAYLKALYGKMRTLEPSLEDRIDLTESAALKAVSKSE